jgi:membrane protease YdiL (CAAX protease family)
MPGVSLLNSGAASVPRSGKLVEIMCRHPLLFYFLMAFAFSWAYEIIAFGFFSPDGSLAALLVVLGLTLIGPTLSAFIMTALTQGKPGMRRLLRRYVLWRVGLQRGYGPLVGTLILGVLWGLWHLPLFILIPGYDGAGTDFVGILVPFLAFVVEATALAVLFTWVFNNVRGSLLLMMLLHGTLNTATNTLPTLFPALASSFFVQMMPIVVAVIAALLIIVVTRGRLSYQRYQQEAEFLDLPPSMEQTPAVPATAV